MSNVSFKIGDSVKLNVFHPDFNGIKFKIDRIQYSKLYCQDIFICVVDNDVYFALEKELILVD